MNNIREILTHLILQIVKIVTSNHVFNTIFASKCVCNRAYTISKYHGDIQNK